MWAAAFLLPTIEQLKRGRKLPRLTALSIEECLPVRKNDDSDPVFHLRPYLQLRAVYSSLDLYRCGLMLCNNGMLVLMEHSV